MIEKFTSKSGLDVYVEPTPGVKSLDARLIVQTGSIHETEDVAGISHALEHSLFLRTPDFPTEEDSTNYANEHAFYHNASTSYVGTLYETSGLEPDAMFHFLGEVVLHPLFGKEATAKEMNAVRREAKSGLDNVATLAGIFGDYAMFGAPYGRKVIGHSDNLDFTEEKLIEYYKSHYTLDKTSLLVIGDTSLEAVEKLVDNHFDFSDYTKTYPEASLPTPKPSFEGQYSFGHLREDSESAIIRLSVQRTMDITEGMRKGPWQYLAAMDVISKKIFSTLRIDLGLSYDGSFGSSGYNPPSARRMYAHVTVDPENTDKAIAALRDIMSLNPDSYTDEELRRHLNGQRFDAAGNVDDLLGRADFYARNYLSHGLEPVSVETLYDMLQHVTVEDVRMALNHMYEVWQSSPQYETVTGPQQAMGNRALVAQNLFA